MILNFFKNIFLSLTSFMAIPYSSVREFILTFSPTTTPVSVDPTPLAFLMRLQMTPSFWEASPWDMRPSTQLRPRQNDYHAISLVSRLVADFLFNQDTQGEYCKKARGGEASLPCWLRCDVLFLKLIWSIQSFSHTGGSLSSILGQSQYVLKSLLRPYQSPGLH